MTTCTAPRRAPPNGTPRITARGSAMASSPMTTARSTPSQIRRSAPRTPEPRRSANRARPTLNNPAVMNVTVAEDAAPTTHASAVPPLSRQEHPESGDGRQSRPKRALGDAFVVETRRVRGPAQEGEPEKDPARVHAEDDPRLAHDARGCLPEREQPPDQRHGDRDRRQRRRDRRVDRAPQDRVKATPARAAPAKASIERGASAGPDRLSTSTYTRVTQAASSSGGREQGRRALRRRVRAHRRSASRDRVDIRHSARRPSAHERTRRRRRVRTRRR